MPRAVIFHLILSFAILPASVGGSVSGRLTQDPNSAQTLIQGFGTCAWWARQKRQMEAEKTSLREALEMYRVGYAHGFAKGSGAPPAVYFFPLNPSGIPAIAPLYGFSIRGFEVALGRPAVLVEAFDAKCLDYRNERVSLTDIGLISILELGGIQPARVEEALRVLRLGEPVEIQRLKVFNALTGSTSPR